MNLRKQIRTAGAEEWKGRADNTRINPLQCAACLHQL